MSDDRAPAVRVVTDSTCQLPADLVARLGIIVVPMQVQVDGRHGREGVDIDAAVVLGALRNGRPVMTSQPTTDALTQALDAAAEGGAAVVAVHLSSELSGTASSMRALARRRPGTDGTPPVRVVDTRSLGLGLGYAVLAAAEEAARGGDVGAVELAAEHAAASSRVLFYVDDIDHLRRGGRLGAASARLAAALHVKPLLALDQGRIALVEKVRTPARALDRLEQLAVLAADGRPVDIGVHHLDAPARAAQLADHLRYRLPHLDRLITTEVGPSVAAHTGPGMLAVVVQHR